MARSALDALLERPGRSGVFLDFDGTLSEIVPTPDAARPVEGVPALLEALADRFRLVAIVSGRRAADVADRVGAPGRVRCFGLYGLEDRSGPTGSGAEAMIARTERALPDVERAAASVPGSSVEPKGLQVAVHYRASPDPEHTRRVLLARLDEVAGRHGLRLVEGKRVLELASPGVPTKGDVVRRVSETEGLEAVLYAGDDLADLEAFAAVDALAERGLHGAKVAVRSSETPQRVLEVADVVVEGPVGLVELLRQLAG